MNQLERILVTPLQRIAVEGGDVMHALKRDDPGFAGFGEAYFTWIKPGRVKAWKRHVRMTLNLVVPIGEVKLVFWEPSGAGKFRAEVIGTSRYARVTVPPGIWFGFQGCDRDASLVLNLADIPHQPDEVERCPVTGISYNWSNP